MKSWGGKKLWTLADLQSRFYKKSNAQIDYLGHHFSHALQAFLGSGFERSAILIVDAVGDWSCTSLFQGFWENGRPIVKGLREVAFPHSLGLVYSAVTAHVGFTPNESECSTMALAAFGQPRFAEDLARIIPENGDLYSIDQRYFNFVRYYRGAVTKEFIKKFGPARNIKKQPLPFHSFAGSGPVDSESQRFADLAASIQKVLEDRMIQAAKLLKKETGEENLCLAGGVALNCVANSALYNSGIFRDIFIPSDPGDGGTSIGSALYSCALHSPSSLNPADLKYSPYLGPTDAYEPDIQMLDFVSPAAAKAYSISPQDSLNRWQSVKKISFQREDDLCERVAEKLISKKIVGWFQGRSEFGPRALGNRSILIRPDCIDTAKRLSQFVKMRAGYRPYALAMTNDCASRILDINNPLFLARNRWMQYAVKVNAPYISQVRAGLHVDLTTRPQACHPSENPLFCRMLQSFGAKFGIETCINTSFNPSGYPIVTYPSEALAMFYRTDMDALVLGNWLIWKE
jgi:carbamoyltransferase